MPFAFVMLLLTPVDLRDLTVPIVYASQTNLTSTTTVAIYIKERALSLGVDPVVALAVAKGESGFIASTTGDKEIICPVGPNKGQPVWARGIYQITRCYYPDITDEQAYDPKFNIDFAMPLIKDKTLCMQQFTECRKYYNSLPK